jgi:hypothetical protein
VVGVASDSHNHSESDWTCETEKRSETPQQAGAEAAAGPFNGTCRLAEESDAHRSPGVSPREGTRVPIRGGCDLCRQPANTSESDVAL